MEKGQKFSSSKAPLGMMMIQFPLALEAVAHRSKTGHEGKYKESDKDWMNFKRVPNALEEYTNATARHLAEIGEDEDFIGHAAATAWNALAKLQILLEDND